MKIEINQQMLLKLLLMIILFFILSGHLLCGCCRYNIIEGMVNVVKKKKETFINGNNTSSGSQYSLAKSADWIMDPNKWSMPTLTYSQGTTPSIGVESILSRPKQPIPLPEGELDLFSSTKFDPSCCPNTYSSSTGCACMTVDQYNYLRDRGGNNVPYSEY